MNLASSLVGPAAAAGTPNDKTATRLAAPSTRTFDGLVSVHIKSKRLKRVLSSYSPSFPGFYLYYPSRRQQPSKLKAFVEHLRKHAGGG